MKKTAVVLALVAGWVTFGVLGADVTPAQAVPPPAVLPLPSSLLMMGLGLAALVTHRRRSK